MIMLLLPSKVFAYWGVKRYRHMFSPFHGSTFSITGLEPGKALPAQLILIFIWLSFCFGSSAAWSQIIRLLSVPYLALIFVVLSLSASVCWWVAWSQLGSISQTRLLMCPFPPGCVSCRLSCVCQRQGASRPLPVTTVQIAGSRNPILLPILLPMYPGTPYRFAVALYNSSLWNEHEPWGPGASTFMHTSDRIR